MRNEKNLLRLDPVLFLGRLISPKRVLSLREVFAARGPALKTWKKKKENITAASPQRVPTYSLFYICSDMSCRGYVSDQKDRILSKTSLEVHMNLFP